MRTNLIDETREIDETFFSYIPFILMIPACFSYCSNSLFGTEQTRSIWRYQMRILRFLCAGSSSKHQRLNQVDT